MGLSPFRRVIHLPVNTNIMTRDIFFEVEVLRCGRIPAPGIALCCALGGPSNSPMRPWISCVL